MKKKLIITFSVIAVLAAAGYFGYRFAVNYVFDEYVMKSALTALSNSEKDGQNEENNGGEIKVQAILDGLAGKNEETHTGEKKEEKTGGDLKSEESKTDKKDDKKDEAGKKEASESKNRDSGNETQQSGEKTTQKSGSALSDSEILSRVMSDSSLAYKMASMVSYEDKQAVIAMVMSNFSAEQLSKMVASGMSKSEMISVARKSITGAQWNQCMAIARKYVDQIRPYVE